jgi:erythronate-4-phosphate dehydrogenase
MPFVVELFSEFADIQLLPGRDISRNDLIDADVLLVRSVTKVDQLLLQGTGVKFVGSATIGTDHIHMDYLHRSGIQFAHAPGCNAEAVVQYDLSVMCRLMPGWRGKTVGIIGCGNVGGRLYQRLCDLNVSCSVYDPFLSAAAVPDLTDLDTVLACDIICLHTPITKSGQFPSYHLLDAQRLGLIRPDALIINAGRGAAIDNRALLELFQKGSLLQVALDVWEGEPSIDINLMGYVAMATPHIAGYSLEGKINGTQMVFDGFLDWAGKVAKSEPKHICHDKLLLEAESLNEAILDCYDVALDHQRMVYAIGQVGLDAHKVAHAFDLLRKDYPVRREFSHYGVEVSTENIAQYQRLGFAVV